MTKQKTKRKTIKDLSEEIDNVVNSTNRVLIENNKRFDLIKKDFKLRKSYDERLWFMAIIAAIQTTLIAVAVIKYLLS